MRTKFEEDTKKRLADHLIKLAEDLMSEKIMLISYEIETEPDGLFTNKRDGVARVFPSNRHGIIFRYMSAE